MDSNIIGIIGDIHGCFNTLETIYDKIKDLCSEIYTVGDLIDRGEYSRNVIDFCISENIKTVRGNHEDMMLKTIHSPSYETIPGYETPYDLWMLNGGDLTMKNYSLSSESDFLNVFSNIFKTTGHYDFILNLPLKYEFENIIISHAGIVNGASPSNIFWNRDIPSKLDKIQVVGHNPSMEIIHRKNHYLNTDTGCVYGNMLSAVIIDVSDGKLLQTFSVPTDTRDI